MPAETIERPGVDTPGSLGLPGFDLMDDLRNGSNINGPWIVILYNCDCHTFDDVIGILQKATGCTVEEGERIAMEVDQRGRSICFSGSREECERVATIIASIRLQVETDRA